VSREQIIQAALAKQLHAEQLMKQILGADND